MQTLLQFDAPRQHHSATSCAAAEAIQPHLGRMQKAVLAYITQHGPITDNQIIAGMAGNPNTIRPRRVELQRAGLIQACGEKDGSQLWRAK